MAAATVAEMLAIHRKVARLRRYSDRLIGIGPFGVGLDGVLAWIPGIGTAYSAGAAAWLFIQAFKVGASPATLARMAAYLGLNTASSVAPIWGYALDTLFPGILMAAGALMKDIEARHPEARPAKSRRWSRGGRLAADQPGAARAL
jgi:hypothetical protein